MRGIVKGPPPKDIRGWDRTFGSLNEHVKSNEHTAFLVSDTVTLTTRPEARLVGIMQHLGDAGRATSQRLLPMVTFGNRGSVQDVQPLTSTSDAAISQVTIAAHSLYTDFATIPYGAGSITGLTPATTYYIYADDPDFEGGAVSYLATTAATNNVGTSGRYIVGAITTPGAHSSASVIAITQADPGVVTTSAAHPYETGYEILFSGVTGMIEVNGQIYTITVIDPTTFTIAVDTTGFGAYVSGGTVTRITDSSSGSGGGGAGGGGNTWTP